MRQRFDTVQRVGRALMLPIAVLPFAGLLLRLGQPDLLNLSFMAAAGNAVFANLGLLFAAGIAVGLAKENNGAAAVAGVVCFLIITEGAKTLLTVPDGLAPGPVAEAWKSGAIAKMSVPIGLAAGLVSGHFYNRFHAINVPEYLAFFGGRRFVPIAAGGAGLVGALIVGLGLPTLEHGVDTLSQIVLRSGSFGLFLYGALNRLLLVTGLHHILNNMAWFVLGDYHGATGDLKRFFAGDPTAGGFMSGFFPVMMFGLPAACLAMYRAALPENRARVGGLLFSLSLTSFLTGVTEPIEFTFMFLAPVLYALHAVMTGLAMVIMNILGVKLGFTFSAGLADYVINFGLAQKPLLLLPIGAVYALLYYAVFAFAIRRFNLMTPGREVATEASVEDVEADDGDRGAAFVRRLGGAANISNVDACTTRLRLTLVDVSKADEGGLKQLGARGVLRPGGGAVQVVLGPIADMVAGEIRHAMLHAGATTGAAPVREATLPSSPSTQDGPDLSSIIAAVGGSDNIAARTIRGNRLLLTLHRDIAGLTDQKIEGVRAVARTGEGHFHLILDRAAT